MKLKQIPVALFVPGAGNFSLSGCDRKGGIFRGMEVDLASDRLRTILIQFAPLVLLNK